MDKSDTQKLNAMIRFLTEDHLETHGGYPYDYDLAAGILFVAGLDPGKERAATMLESWGVDDLIEWYDEARWYERHNKVSWTEALHETRP